MKLYIEPMADHYAYALVNDSGLCVNRGTVISRIHLSHLIGVLAPKETVINSGYKSSEVKAICHDLGLQYPATIEQRTECEKHLP